MRRRQPNLEDIRIASPCKVNWDDMKGDNRSRHCEQCNLNVYNFADLTRAEISDLIAEKEGRVCARLYRRADGNIITADCPVGLRRLRMRMAGIGGAIATAIFSIAAGVYGQGKNGQPGPKPGNVQFSTVDPSKNTSAFSGVVFDLNFAIVPGADVKIRHISSGQLFTATTDDTGTFTFGSLPAGEYSFDLSAAGFKKFKAQKFILLSDSHVVAKAVLDVDLNNVTVGILVANEPVYSNGTLTLRP
jgi:hypothetical protein